jgi:hypothetical protein
MSDDERPLFDDEIIQMYRQYVPDTLEESRKDFTNHLNSVTDISNNQLRILLGFSGETTFRFLPILCQSSAINMALMNDIDKVINNLPEQFHQIKKQYRELVKFTKEEHEYVKWAKKVHEDLAKDIDKND